MWVRLHAQKCFAFATRPTNADFHAVPSAFFPRSTQDFHWPSTCDDLSSDRLPVLEAHRPTQRVGVRGLRPPRNSMTHEGVVNGHPGAPRLSTLRGGFFVIDAPSWGALVVVLRPFLEGRVVLNMLSFGVLRQKHPEHCHSFPCRMESLGEVPPADFQGIDMNRLDHTKTILYMLR